MAYLRVWLMLCLAVCSFSANAVIETYSFANDNDQKRFKALIAELRCPKCQNQNLADSNSEISIDLRAEVYRLINDGATDEMIVDHLVDRYGDFVRYKPPVDKHTVWLWFLPALMLVFGVFIAFFIALRSRGQSIPSAAALSDSEREQLEKITGGKS